MRKCRIYTITNNSGYENEGLPGDYLYGFTNLLLTDDGFVLSPELCWNTLKALAPDDPNRSHNLADESAYENEEPAKIVDGLKLYTPYKGTFISRNRDNCRLILPFEVDGKWGYCHAFTGKVLLEPQWDFCDEFDGDFSRIYIGDAFDPMSEAYGGNGLWGLIECTSQFYGDCEFYAAIKPGYQYLSRSGGMDYGYMLAKKNGFWGIIAIPDYDTIVVAFEWDGIWFDYDREWEDRYGGCPNSGFVAMKDRNGRKQYSALNVDGKIMIENMSSFIPPAYPKQYICSDEEEL